MINLEISSAQKKLNLNLRFFNILFQQSLIVNLYQQQIIPMSVRRASESMQSSIAQRTCMKHPERYATHQLASKGANNDVFYCQKCSIMLASQGYNVIKLSTGTPPVSRKSSIPNRNSRGAVPKQYSILSNRKNQISKFIDNLQSLNLELSRKVQYIQEFLIKSQTEHGRMIQQANRYYQQIQQIIELQKYTTYNSILNKRSLDQAKARSTREAILEASEQIEAILGDIRQNMDAVQTVDYSIYNAIMGGYQVKSEKLKMFVKQTINIKPLQKYQILLPQIPKALYALSDKVSILIKKGGSSTVNNSVAASVKIQRVPTEDQAVCMSQSNENEHSQIIQQQECLSNRIEKQVIQMPDLNPKQIINSRRDRNQLAFSFDQNSDNSKQVKINDDSNILESSNINIMRGFEEGKLSKISQRFNSKQVFQSRQSLGQYLNISNSRDRQLNQDTETLLIA